MKQNNKYNQEIIRQFKDWEKGKASYLWKRRIEIALPHLPANGLVLDAGCGDSSVVDFFRKMRPDLRFYAADLSLLRFKGFVRANIQELPFDGESFNGITLLAVIEHVLDQKQLIRECQRILKPGGVLLVTTPNPLYGIPMAMAGTIGLKYKEGYDNGISLESLSELATSQGMRVEETLGFLAAPFKSPLESIEETLGSNRYARKLLMNQFFKARKVK